MLQRVADALPLVAAALAIPQFAPQFVRLLRRKDPTGVSWTGLALTCVHNCAWVAYFVASGYGSAVPTAAAVAAGAAATALLLSRVRRSSAWDVTRVAAWSLTLAAIGLTTTPALLGTVLAIAASAQLVPSVWTAYRDPRPTGISLGTWVLVAGELLCWGIYGGYRSDPRLIVLGTVGTVGGSLVAARVIWARGIVPTQR